MDKVELALRLRKEGCNCAQAALCAFTEETGLDEATLMNLAEGFGGGLGGIGSVCGAVSGIIMAANLIFGNVDVSEPKASKEESYKRTKNMVTEFLDKNTSIICSELKGNGTTPPLRSCNGCVEDAVAILDKYIKQNSES